MTKKYLIILISLITANTLLWYLCAAFVSLSFNIVEWTTDTRVSVCIVWGFCNIGATVISLPLTDIFKD